MSVLLRRFGSLAVVLCLVVGLAACGDDDNTAGPGSDKSSEDSGTGGAPSLAKNDIEATPRDEVQDGGTFRWPLDQIPSNFNPSELDGALDDNFDVLGSMLPSMFTVNAAGELEEDPNYLLSADLQTDPKQVVTYKLNPKAKWNDGEAVDFDDFETLWKALNGSDPAYKVVSTTGYENIESVEKGADDFEVIVTFKDPYADWKGLFGLMTPASTNSDPKVFNEGWIEKPLASAGPFKFDNLDKSAETITVVRDDAWWGNPAKLDKIIFLAIAAGQETKLANNEIDWMDIGTDIDAFRVADAADGVDMRKAAGPNWRVLTINATSPILKDVEVRRALAKAIDRDVISQALLEPLGYEAEPLNNHIFVTGQKGYQSNAGDLETADAAAAKGILEDAGWTEGSDGIMEKDGKKLKINIVIPAEVPTSAKESELMQSMVKEAGFDLKIEVVPSDPFFDDYVTPGKFDLTLF